MQLGGLGGARRGQVESGGARRCQEDPGGARRSQEEEEEEEEDAKGCQGMPREGRGANENAMWRPWQQEYYISCCGSPGVARGVRKNDKQVAKQP